MHLWLVLSAVLSAVAMHGCSDSDSDSNYAMLAHCSSAMGLDGADAPVCLSREQVEAAHMLCAISSDEAEETSPQGVQGTSSTAMLLSMRARGGPSEKPAEWDGSHERRGRYDRSGEDVKKRQSSAVYAVAHRKRIEGNTFGVPCGVMCLNNRQCGRNFTQATLLAAHERVYGTQPPEDVKGKLTLARASSEIQRTRRALMLSWITRDAVSNRSTESYMVERMGPVCADFAKAAYGFHDWTWNAMHGAAVAGSLQVEVDLDTAGVPTRLDAQIASTAEMAVTWWKLWLQLEDQMPNEPTIVYRAVQWTTVYDDEYAADMAMWSYGVVSRSRWMTLRKEALESLSLEYFGQVSDCDRDDTRLSQAQQEMLLAGEGFSVPVCMLSLRQRAQHSNFSGCTECTEARAKWIAFRRSKDRCSGADAQELKRTLFSHIENVKRERQACAHAHHFPLCPHREVSCETQCMYATLACGTQVAMELHQMCASRSYAAFEYDDKCGSQFIHQPTTGSRASAENASECLHAPNCAHERCAQIDAAHARSEHRMPRVC